MFVIVDLNHMSLKTLVSDGIIEKLKAFFLCLATAMRDFGT